MANETKEFMENLKAGMAKMHEQMPKVAAGFGGLFENVMGDGAISMKDKELIALSIAVAVQCKPCIVMHCDKALKAGATKEQILEAAGVAVVMAGGPAFTHLPEVINALEELG